MPRYPFAPGSSFCPSCLAQPDPYWRREWSNALVPVCARHHRLLVLHCPSCGKRAHVSPFGAQQNGPVWACPSRREVVDRRSRTRRPHCGADLREVHADIVPADAVGAVERLRVMIENAAARRDVLLTTPAPGWQISHHNYIHAVLSLVHQQVDWATWASAGPRRLLDAIVVADAVMRAPTLEDFETLCSRHGVLDPAGDYSLKPSTTAQRDRTLMALRLRSLAPHLSLATRLACRTSSSWPQIPFSPSGGEEWPAHGWVPPVMWGHVVDELGLSDHEHAGAAMSLALSKVGANVSMRVIATDLGLPGWLADRVAAVLRRTDIDRLVTTLDELFSHLSDVRSPINYSNRVIFGRDQALMHFAVNQALGADAGNVGSSELEAAAVALWTAYTGSSAIYCPWAAPGTRAAVPPFVDEAEFLASGYLALPHSENEPLAWTPP